MKQIFTLLFLAISTTVFAQHPFEFQQKNDIKLVIGTDTLRQPWVGGLNSPVFSTIKLNNDATEDLYVFDRNSKKSYTFLADNSSGTGWQWKYAPEYEAYFPKNLEFWVLLRDFDGDGKKDLFTGDQMGTWLYKNDPLSSAPLAFATTPRNLRFDLAPNMPLGSYVLPAFTDVDNDGDLDILVFDDDKANTVIFYKNRSIELGYGDDSLRLTRQTQFWGQFSRCNGACSTFEFAAVTCRAAAGPMHGGGASLLAIDLDGDIDKDIIVGADMCPDLVRLTNKGTTTLARMDSTGLSLTYPTGTTPASIINFPAAYYEDVNFDGKKDLLVSPYLADNLDKANFVNSVWFYQNNAASATASPVFAFNQNNFLQNKMFDVGLEAMPAMADIDADGDLDLLVGNFADYRFGGTSYRSSVSLYTNVGTAAKPIFKLTNNDYLQFSQANYRGIQLQFADMNSDGSKDLIIKYQPAAAPDGQIGFITNMAAPGQPFSLSRANQAQLGITINDKDNPFFYDVDGDGDLDLLLGTDSNNGTNQNSGAIHYIRRVGANPTLFPSWQMFNDSFGRILRVAGHMGVRPVVADLDHDNQPDLITADNSGELNLYSNVLSNPNGTFVGTSSVLTNPLLGPNQKTRLGLNPHIAVGDLDNDQKPDLLVGINGGGLLHFKNYSQPLGITEDLESLKIKVYPNPAQKVVTISAQEKIKVMLYDLTGRKIKQNLADPSTEHKIDVSALKPGLYLLKIVSDDFRAVSRKLIIQE